MRHLTRSPLLAASVPATCGQGQDAEPPPAGQTLPLAQLHASVVQERDRGALPEALGVALALLLAEAEDRLLQLHLLLK